MNPDYQTDDGRVTLYRADCETALAAIPDNSVDAIVTDPPYGLAFMGKRWDYDVPSEAIWRECLRVLKPGGHLLCFAGTRTHHRMVVRIEDAGFEIRDMIAWVYGSGFPKSLDVSKAIDAAAGVERERIRGVRSGVVGSTFAQDAWSKEFKDSVLSTVPITPYALRWHGWGTALKPALEPITVARKPLDGTVAANVLAWGCGGININGCRVGTDEGLGGGSVTSSRKNPMSGDTRTGSDLGMFSPGAKRKEEWVQPQGRWPANLIHDGSDEVTRLFPESDSTRNARPPSDVGGGIWKPSNGQPVRGDVGDSGSAARFFYAAKASKEDRNEGCESIALRTPGECTDRQSDTAGLNSPRAGAGRTGGARNHHPTVKPVDLMRYLCRLVTPPDGVVLDPFMGSGSTGKGAVLEGFRFIGIEREQEYIEIAWARIGHAAMQPIQEGLPL